MSQLVLILGGARSGKSRFAQELAQRIGGDDVLFVATAEAGDAEMARRIQIHQQSRPSVWTTVEAPQQIGSILAEAANDCGTVIVDCLTLLVSNILLACGEDHDPAVAEKRVRRETDAVCESCRRRPGTVIVVSGEVGQGLVPDHPLGRQFRDLLGWANQSLAAEADAAYLLVAGIPVELKSLAATVDQAAARFNGP